MMKEVALIVLAAALMFLILSIATAKDLTFPVKESDCGSLGNVIATAQNMRNEGVALDSVKKMLKDSSDACVQENGESGCILQDQAGKDMINDMLDMIWKSPPTDPRSFGFEVYTHCLQANKGKVM